jgi:hypothetical protein
MIGKNIIKRGPDGGQKYAQKSKVAIKDLGIV